MVYDECRALGGFRGQRVGGKDELHNISGCGSRCRGSSGTLGGISDISGKLARLRCRDLLDNVACSAQLLLLQQFDDFLRDGMARRSPHQPHIAQRSLRLQTAVNLLHMRLELPKDSVFVNPQQRVKELTAK